MAGGFESLSRPIPAADFHATNRMMREIPSPRESRGPGVIAASFGRPSTMGDMLSAESLAALYRASGATYAEQVFAP